MFLTTIPKTYYQINQYIRQPELRVIDENGVQIGILKTPEALARAQSVGLDLIVITDKAVPPIAKIIDFQKYKYQQDKKTRSGAIKTKATEVKEVRITPFMAEKDFSTRLGRAEEFLQAGHRVKIVVKFVGRQLAHKEFGQQQIDRASQKLADVGTIEAPAKWQGKLMVAQYKPKSGGPVGATDKETQNEKGQS